MEDNTSVFDEGAPVDAGVLRPIIARLDDALALQDEIEALEELLKTRKKDLHILRTKALPDAMASAGVSSFESDKGVKVNVEQFVSGSLPKDPEERTKAFDELIKAGGKDLIVNNIDIVFTKSQHNEAISVFEGLKEQGYAPSLTEKVHPQTLYAFVREKLRNGDPLNYKVLGVFVGQVAKITKGGKK